MPNIFDIEALRRLQGRLLGSAVHQAPVMIHTASIEAIGGSMAAGALGAPAAAVGGAWPTANLAVLIPFVLHQYVTVRKLYTYNGATVSGNVDVGVYDEAFARRVARGGAAQVGSSTIQEHEVTDTDLGPGRYYLAFVADNTTATVFRWSSPATTISAVLGMGQMASAYPLPLTFTPATMAISQVPWVGLALRTLVQ